MYDKTHNGWSNYETWCVALWIDNERFSYERWRSKARDYVRLAPKKFPAMFPETNPNEVATGWLANRLRAEIEDGTPVLAAGVYGDLLSAALAEVDWREVAEHLVNDVTHETALCSKGNAS